MEGHILPECYFDTVLVKTILNTNGRLNHKKGCANVIIGITKSKQLSEDFALGIIDKDKRELDYLKLECVEEIKVNNLALWKHKTKPHYFIQLVPALEKWILTVSEEREINIEEFGLPKDLDKLKKRTKSELVEEDKNLRKFCQKLVDEQSETMKTLTTWLRFLVEHNRDADINKLR